jgi:hypothetical protein
MSISSAQKGVFFPEESAYSAKVRAILDTARYFHDTNYPIKLIDKPLFQKAYYRGKRELNNLMQDIDFTLLLRHDMRFKKLNENVEKEYFIISCDNEYIYIGIIKEGAELYTKYNPIKEDNKAMPSFIKARNFQKFYYWIIQEMNKGSIISITGNSRTRIAKSFNGNLTS